MGSQLLKMTNSKTRFQKKTAIRFLRHAMRQSSGLMQINLVKRKSMNTNKKKLNKFVIQSSQRCTKLQEVHQVVCLVACQVASLVLMELLPVLELQVLVAHLDLPLKKLTNKRLSLPCCYYIIFTHST